MPWSGEALGAQSVAVLAQDSDAVLAVQLAPAMEVALGVAKVQPWGASSVGA